MQECSTVGDRKAEKGLYYFYVWVALLNRYLDLITQRNKEKLSSIYIIISYGAFNNLSMKKYEKQVKDFIER